VSDINMGFLSGTVVGDKDFREWDGGKSVEIKVSVFAREYTDRSGNPKRIQHQFTFACSTREKHPNPLYPEVAGLNPGEWVLLRYELDQIHYEKNDEPRTFDKRTVTEIVQHLRLPQADNRPDDPDVPF